MSPIEESRAATRAVARYVTSSRLDDAPANATEIATKVITDSIAAAIAGASSDLAPTLATYVRRNAAAGDAAIVGLPGGFEPESAALANGTLGHALDFDDVVTIYPAHPSVVVVSALFAAAAGSPVTGRQIVESYVVGMQAGAQIARGIGLGHYNRGWHGTGTLALFTAACATAKLRGLSESEVETAIGVASSLSSGLQRNFGTMTKPLHAGWAARSAVVACELASLGWTANREMLETGRGFFAVYGDQRSDPARVGAHLDGPHVFIEPGVALKKYPCVWGSHRAIDGVLALMSGHLPDEIAAIECHAPPAVFDQLQFHRPTTGLEGKFSGEYVIAAAALDSRVVLGSFTDEAVRRPEVAALYERIEFAEDPRCAVRENAAAAGDDEREEAPGESGFIETTISFTNGAVETAVVTAPIGSTANPMSWDDIRDKFLDCAAYASMDASDAAGVVDRLEKLVDLPDATSLIGELSLPESELARSFSA